MVIERGGSGSANTTCASTFLSVENSQPTYCTLYLRDKIRPQLMTIVTPTAMGLSKRFVSKLYRILEYLKVKSCTVLLDAFPRSTGDHLAQNFLRKI
jgi:hypothetical protein